MKPHSNVLVERGGALLHHPAQRALFKHAFSLFEQTFKRTLVQFWRMLYNDPYFVDFIKGYADELIEDAPGARSPPKRKKPTVSTPLVSGINILLCAGRTHWEGHIHQSDLHRYVLMIA